MARVAAARAIPRSGVAAGALAAQVLRLLTTLAVAALISLTPAVPATAATAPGPVVLVGIGDGSWPAAGDVSPFVVRPVQRLASRGSVGSVSVRTGQSPTCPVDGWLTVSAGRRAVELPRSTDGRCGQLPAVAVDPSSVSHVVDPATGRPDPRHAGRVVGWDRLRATNQDSPYGARLGALAGAIAGNRACITAAGPGAALAAADASGNVDAWVSDPFTLTREMLSGCPVTIIDAGPSVAVSAVLLAQLQLLLPINATLLVVGVDDVPAGATGAPGAAGLRIAGAVGPGFPAPPRGGLLTSDATRWPGVVTLTDVAPTVLAAAGITARPAGFVGSRWRSVAGPPAAATLNRLRVDAVRARVAQDTIPRFYSGFGTAAGLLLIAAVVTGRWAPRWRAAGPMRGAGLVVAAAPVATRLASLVPWWWASAPELALPAAVAGWALVVAGAAWTAARVVHLPAWQRRRASTTARGPTTGRGVSAGRSWRTAGLIVAWVTLLTVTADLLAGSPLQRLTVVGLTPIQGGRFYGMGNEIFAATAICALVAVAGLAVRRPGRAVTGCLAMGTGFVVLDGLPSLGADFGGVPAAVLGFAVAALALGSARPRLGWVAVGAAAAVLVLAGVVGFDLSRPAGQRSHVGAFATDLLSGSGGDVVARKASAAAGPLLFRIDNAAASAFAWFGVAVLLVVALVLLRPGLARGTAFGRLLASWPQLRAVLVGAVALGIVGGLLNDSGVAVPLIMCEVGVGLVVAWLPGTDSALPDGSGRDPAGSRADRPVDLAATADAGRAGPTEDGWETL